MEPTELESCVLGIVWERGPCTAYVIRTVFKASLSSYWSGSAGAIYPLVARLEARGLIAAKTAAWGERSKKELTITPEGLAALRSWLQPLPDWTGSPPVDPIRTRMFFLGVLPKEEWTAFLGDAEARIRADIEAVREECETLQRKGETLNALATRGGLYAQEARLRWLTEVRRELEKG